MWCTVFCFQIGDPKCLDGQRADLVVCRPEAGGSCWRNFPHQFHVERVDSVDGRPLGLDYLETMWHAFEDLWCVLQCFTFCSHIFNTPFESLWQCFITKSAIKMRLQELLEPGGRRRWCSDVFASMLWGLNRLCSERLVPSSLVARAAEI